MPVAATATSQHNDDDRDDAIRSPGAEDGEEMAVKAGSFGEAGGD
jgi:hypothetical protein